MFQRVTVYYVQAVLNEMQKVCTLMAIWVRDISYNMTSVCTHGHFKGITMCFQMVCDACCLYAMQYSTIFAQTTTNTHIYIIVQDQIKILSVCMVQQKSILCTKLHIGSGWMCVCLFFSVFNSVHVYIIKCDLVCNLMHFDI